MARRPSWWLPSTTDCERWTSSSIMEPIPTPLIRTPPPFFFSLFPSLRGSSFTNLLPEMLPSFQFNPNLFCFIYNPSSKLCHELAREDAIAKSHHPIYIPIYVVVGFGSPRRALERCERGWRSTSIPCDHELFSGSAPRVFSLSICALFRGFLVEPCPFHFTSRHASQQHGASVPLHEELYLHIPSALGFSFSFSFFLFENTTRTAHARTPFIDLYISIIFLFIRK